MVFFNVIVDKYRLQVPLQGLNGVLLLQEVC